MRAAHSPNPGVRYRGLSNCQKRFAPVAIRILEGCGVSKRGLPNTLKCETLIPYKV